MCSSPSCGMLTNSGMLTARLLAVEFSIRMAGLSLPSSSMWVRNICVYGERLLEENTSHRPFGEKLCHEFMSGVLHRMRRASPHCAGTIYNWLSGRINCPFLHFTKPIQRPSGDTFGKVLLIPFADAPPTGSGTPPLPPLNATR